MISTDLKRVQIQDIVENQLPAFARDDFPLIVDFLKQYYISQEYPGAPVDLLQNIDQYLKIDSLTNNTSSAVLSDSVSILDSTITVDLGTFGTLGTYQFPEKYGLLQIDDEVILYTGKTKNTFTGCIRGFSGITSYKSKDRSDKLTFTESEVQTHDKGSTVINLSNLLLEEFLIKVKTQFAPGFQNRELDSDVNQKLFISRVKDFYQSKGTDKSFKVLFSALYGEEVEVLKPKDFLFKPSNAEYRVTKDLVVEAISGNPLELKNQTLFQDSYDEYDIEQAYASITDVEKLLHGDKTFYQLSVDFDYSKDITFDGSVLGDFSIHPKTKVVNDVSIGSSIIDVDSTLGFPDSGELVATNSSGSAGILTYRSKSTTQFFGVGIANTTVVGIKTAISAEQDVRINSFAYGFVGSGSSRVDMRIGSVLSEPVINTDTYYYNANDSAKIKSLGITTTSAKAANWLYNISTKFDVESVTISDSSVPSYSVVTIAKNNFRVGDSIDITSSATSTGTIISIVDENEFIISGQGELTGGSFTVKRNILKPNVDTSISQYSYLENLYADVQNTYLNFDEDLLVSSSSLPNYYDSNLTFYDKKIELDGSYSGETFTVSEVTDHGYQTGDAVFYNKNITQDATFGFDIISGFDIEEGTYFVERVNSTQFKLATSQANLYNQSYVSVSGIVTSNSLEVSEFHNKAIEHQHLLREIKQPVNDGETHLTEPGKIGILANGVEVLNYKSENVVYYGKIESLTVSSGGKNYDIVNPPVLGITDDVGTGATAKCAITGNLDRIEIIDPGFDYVSEPTISISGGNGSGAKASVNTKLIEHAVSFNATEDSARVSLDNDTIGFSTFHKFRHSEKVVYKTDGQTGILGLSTESYYYVETIDASTIKLYKNVGDVISGINTVNLTAFGEGVHRIQSFDKKRVISNIIVDNSGSGYSNKERSTTSVGVNTALDQINIVSHGYKSGEVLKYTASSSSIGGISDGSTYYVSVVDDNNFKLSSVGVGTTTKSFYYNTKQYIDLTSVGSGTHTFNYEPITATLNGEIGVSTFAGQDFNAVIQPIFRGEIESAQVTSNGVGYGASTIIGYNRQPTFTLYSGSGAELLPIVNNGRITEVLVTNQGSDYNSPPELVVSGTGKYAKLIPVISGGKITEVKIESPGIDYESGTTEIEIISSGSEGKFIAEIQQWTVNLVEKNLNTVTDDDGILTSSLNDNYGIQFTHLYAPRNLRQLLFGRSQDNKIQYGVSDLQKTNDEEITSKFHSPIIGWAYDGNPIYGPYGFSTQTGGTIRAMESGYEKVESSARPSSFAVGFFVEDYEFTDNGDLDEHNGRFCVTPEYPNGTYAYFATINPTKNESSGAFAKFRAPVFPYLIGNSYKSKPNTFNFDYKSNQNDYDLNSSDYFRNTTPYQLNVGNVYYDFLYQPNKIKPQSVNINATSKGTIDGVGIITGGQGYQVNDKIVFDTELNAQPAKARVSKLKGKIVESVSVASTTTSNLEIAPYDSKGSYVAFSTSPHGLINLDLVSLTGFNTSINSLQRTFNIGVSTEKFSLTTGVGTDGATGIVTFFNISGGSFKNELLGLRENDILGIGSERIRILNVDKENSRVRVLRAVDSTVASAHTATTVLSEVSRKFTFKSIPENKVKFNLNKQIYFNPNESLGIGTLSGVGIGSTISFSNPGAGLTQIFIPTRNIYLPDHELNTGDVVNYKNNGGQSIEVRLGTSAAYRLNNNSSLFVARVSKDIIGISTFKVGLGSTGTFVGIASTTSSSGLLSLTGIGTGTYHSFTTVKEDVVNAEVTKNLVTVSTSSTHGLSLRDSVEVAVNPTTTTTITVKYNDHNRRIVFNPKTFVAGNVDVNENTITLSNHGFNSGDKVIHTATTSSGGLVNESIYYIFRYSKDKVKLCNTEYEALKFNPKVVDITSASAGTLSEINPSVNGYRGGILKFDLSDSSLSSISNSTLYSAFEFNIYSDGNFKNKFESSSKTKSFEVSKVGNIGISTNASLTLTVSDNIPEKLYYKFTPTNTSFVSSEKQEIVIDTEVSGNNEINSVNSDYSGSFVVTGIGSTEFEYNLPKVPESSSYTTSNSNITYATDSTSAYGSIEDVSITYKGNNYQNVVGVSTIVGVSTNINRKGFILEPSSSSIGKIISTEIDSIGFDYPTDKTLRPVLNLPEILQIEPLASFESIGITSAGQNYSLAPGLVVIDGYTGKQVKDVDLRYNLGDTEVRIVRNTYGIYDTPPTILPVNNSNGVAINDVTYNSSTKEVTVGLNTSYSDSVPFVVGDKVLVENVSVGVGSTGYGFNSSDYDYTLFTLTGANIPLGGSIGVVTFSLNGIIPAGKLPGKFDESNSSGRIVAEKDFPIFQSILKKNNFILGEAVTSNENIGKVESWNNEIEILKVSTTSDYEIDSLIVGETSRTQGRIKRKYDFNAEVKTGSSSIVRKGWRKETGFLNFNTERLSDNDYYQNFSYSLKSKVSLEKWDDAVSSLNHTAGFLKFSDLIIESSDRVFDGVFTELTGSNIDVVSDVSRVIDLNCYPYFDLVTENAVGTGAALSDEIIFSTRSLTDYFESVGNRVLTIDDLSGSFNDEPRPEKFSIVHKFDINQRFKKFFTFVRDKRFTDERQSLMVSILHNKSQAWINQYGRVESVLDLGSFDFGISGTEGQLEFFPTKFAVNNYNVSFASFDIDHAVTGVGTTALGGVVNIDSSQTSVSAGTTTTIVGIASTYRASKVLVEVDGSNGELEHTEISVIHDGSTVELLEFGTLTTDTVDSSYVGTGLGTYHAELSSGSLNVKFSPNVGVAATVNSIVVSLASTATGVGTVLLGDTSENIARVNSVYTSIASSGSPGIHTIAEYTNSGTIDYSTSYCLVSVHDTTNNKYQLSEVILLNDSSDVYITEYGNIDTNGGIGTIGALKTSTKTSLQYTPPASVNTQVRVFQMAVELVEFDETSKTEIDLNNASITAGYGFYSGTETDILRQFGLQHNGRNIFQRDFSGNDSTVIDVTNNLINVPGHFFVTGEELTYASDSTAIGIATTAFAGVGATDLLPSTVYAIKVDDQNIRLARSAEDALKSVPVPLDITSVGVGTEHTFTSRIPNTKCIIAIDNQIQSPIVSTAVTTGIGKTISLTDDIIEFTGITSFFGGDLILIDDEIMKINTVSIGNTNQILVDRQWMGTGLSTHVVGAAVTRIEGDYNIVGNNINFITAPKGPTPLSSTANRPDERDWTGITTFSTFQGRTFLRSALTDTTSAAYNTNYVFDDISQGFNATEKTFTLTSANNNITGFSTNNAVLLINGIFQGPTGSLATNQDYDLTEGSGISSVTFAGTATSLASDPNNASIPVGGVIVSVGSTGGFGYQPLVSAGGTAVVSASGTISSVSIGNSGSGYRAGIQTVNVGVTTQNTGTPSIQNIGTATISGGNIVSVTINTPGSGYTTTNPPIVIFDTPLSYSNIPLEYSSTSVSGSGVQATVDIVVGQGSSVIDFEIRNLGYNYGQQQILTVPVGGSTGIPTDPTKTFSEFKLTIERTESDEFAGWHLGELEVLDKIESNFNGTKRSFTINRNGSPLTIRAAEGSSIDVQATLLVFLNDILQVPGEGYTFTGGSTLTFAEPPKGPAADGSFDGDKCKILFYKGSGDVDVTFRDVLETVKEGDTLRIMGDTKQDVRLVDEVTSSDTVSTLAYTGPGIDGNPDNKRPVTWCKQRNDKFIDGQFVSKSRVLNEALVNPTTNIIQSVGVGTTIVFVSSVKSFFDPRNENQTTANTQKIIIVSQDSVVGASATAIVSAGGTISSVSISDGGKGYSSAPAVTIGNPVGYGTTARANATATISGGVVTSIAVGSTSGFGYTSTSVPQVLIEPPSLTAEVNTSASYTGDFGGIVGVKTTSVGVASTGFVLDFFIPVDSFLRNTSIVGSAITISGIQTGYYFTVSNSNVGSGVTSLYQDGSTLGIGTQFLDGVFEAAAVSVATTAVAGVGITYVARVTTSVSNLGNISGIGLTEYYGDFSWGRIVLGNRTNAKAFNAYTQNGVTGISTSAKVTRVKPLKHSGYS